MITRRRWLASGAAGIVALLGAPRRGAAGSGAASADAARGADLALPADAPVERFDFETRGVEDWTIVAGRWTVEDMDGATSGRKVLVQRTTTNDFDVIVAPPGPFAGVDVTASFKPMSGREDASGGIVFRFQGGRYYVVRANALEDNFRLYAYDRSRRQLASAKVNAPALNRWHTMRVVAIGDRIQAWLDGARLLDHRDARFASGRVGVWTKADSITAFDDLAIRGTVSPIPGRPS